MAATTYAVTVSGSTLEHAQLEAAIHVLGLLLPIAVGLCAWHRPPFERFGALLIASGPLVFLAMLSSSEDAVTYSIGRISAWGLDVFVIYLILAFPTGRLEKPIDRALFAMSVLLLLAFYLPMVPLFEQFPVPAPWATCDAGCPANAFLLANSEPSFVTDIISPLREVFLIALSAALALRIAYRIQRARPLSRRALAPVLGVAVFYLCAYGAALLGRHVYPDSNLVEVANRLIAAFLPLLALAFLFALVRWWVFIARSTQRLAEHLGQHPGPDDLRETLAEAFEDPMLEIVYWIGGSVDGYWGDGDGHRIEHELVPEGRFLTEIREDSQPIAGIVHDAALTEDQAFIDIATSYASIALDNQRLSAQTSALLREVRLSRNRIQAAADDERRRIERDLHDGAQQRLVALRIKLELVAERTGDGDGEGADAIRALGSEVEEAIDEVRSLAHGIYPSSLAHRGLVDGLRAAASRSPVPTTVLAAGVPRYSREIESAAYFVCLEALQNVAKHAEGASGAVIEISDNGALVLEVRDDGAGFDPSQERDGMGLTNMGDRLAAVGGELSLKSGAGHGTRVTATIPLSKSSTP
jgi:signal transduction histidine kinase